MATQVGLDGAWKLRWCDGQRGGLVHRLLGPQADLSRALDAEVPGEVHVDLMRAGLLADPALGLNCLAARWVEETVWYYRRTFTAPALESGERATLTFEGLDLAATVYLNGREVGRHANSFYPCQIDVTAALQAGENVLVVAIVSGLFPPYYKEMASPPAKVSVRREDGRAIFQSEAFAWRVCLDLDGEARLPDNYIGLLPASPLC